MSAPNPHESVEPEQRWNRLIPNRELVPELLPSPGAPWGELVYFAGTYDGYVVCPNTTLLAGLTNETFSAFERDGSLPESLTMLRAALHGEQRRDYWAGAGDGPPPERMELIHAIVEQVRRIVDAARRVRRMAARWRGSRTRS